MKIPFITIYSLLLIITFFLFHYISILCQLGILFFLIFILYIQDRDKIYRYLVFLFFCYVWHYYQYNNLFYNHQEIITSKIIKGTITDKKKLKYKYLYTIQTDSISSKNKLNRIKCKIGLISKKNYSISTYLKIQNLYFLKKYRTKDDCKKDKFGFGFTALASASKIHSYKNKIYKQINKIYEIIFLHKEIIVKNINNYLNNDNIELYNTIFLGQSNKNYFFEKIFSKWGILHYLARSGIHIQIIISLISSILLFIGLSSHYNLIIQFIFLILFYLFSFHSISFLRSFLMFLLFGICYLLKIQTTSLHTLSATVFIISFLYPFSFASLGTQLTFFTTFILSLVHYQKHNQKSGNN